MKQRPFDPKGHAHRWLRGWKRPQRGQDVANVQHAINDRLKSRGQDKWLLRVDGAWGPKSRAAAHHALYIMGVGGLRLRHAKHGSLSPKTQRILRLEQPRTGAQKRRGKAIMAKLKAPRTMFGIDWAWGTPDLAALDNADVGFVARYLSFTPSKNLTRGEARELARRGIDLVVVWETTAGRALAGRAAGVADAKAALAQARSDGWKPKRRDGRDCAIYFAVDFDETPANAVKVASYFRGVASVLGKEHTGAYGSYWAVKRLLDAGVITFAWQTYAWSGGLWDKRAQIHQYSNGHVLAGVSCDYDRTTTDRFGGWRP